MAKETAVCSHCGYSLFLYLLKPLGSSKGFYVCRNTGSCRRRAKQGPRAELVRRLNRELREK